MDQVKAMKVFVRIYERSSFTLAADDLNLPRATLTHTLNQFEAWLGPVYWSAARARSVLRWMARRTTCVACSCWQNWKKPNWHFAALRRKADYGWICMARWPSTL